MAIIPINTLKSKFETGDRPTGSDYADLIDTTAFRADSLGGNGNNAVTINGIENPTVFDTIDTSEWRTIKYFIQFSKIAEEYFKSTELNLVFDGVNANISEFGTVSNYPGEMATISASLNSGIISMTVIPSLTPITVRFYRTGLRA
jgi:hypothetical protein